MVTYEDECVGCPTELGCLGNACPKRHVPHLICDKCGEDERTLYMLDGRELCIDCVKDELVKVEVV